MAIISGLHAKTPQNLQLDAGVLVSNLSSEEIEELSNGTLTVITKKTLGATKGGATFTAVPEMRSLLDGVNGSRGNYQDGQVIDSWEISLKATVSEMTAANIGYGLANNKVEEVISTGKYTKQTGQVGRIAKANFFENMAWIGTIKGKTAPMIILIKGALNANGITFTAEDKNTGSIELELKAHFNLTNPDEVPFEIYIPKEGDL